MNLVEHDKTNDAFAVIIPYKQLEILYDALGLSRYRHKTALESECRFFLDKPAMENIIFLEDYLRSEMVKMCPKLATRK